jgi:hypothetical protein
MIFVTHSDRFDGTKLARDGGAIELSAAASNKSMAFPPYPNPA